VVHAAIQQRIISHGTTLVGRHLRDLHYGAGQIGTGFDGAEFVARWNSSDPADHMEVNAVTGAWDSAINDLNEVLRAAHDVLHPPPAATPGGRAPKGPDMPDIYEALGVGGVISRAAGRKLRAVNRVRNDYTHRYPTATPEQIHGAIDALQQVSRLVIPAVVEWLHSQGYGFPGAPAPASPADTSP